MDEQEKQAWRAKYELEMLDQVRGRQFVCRTFATYPSLQSIEPSEHGWYWWEPYTGQDYDPEKFHVCDDGWDHEHCYVCNASIEPGDEYWESVEPGGTELCPSCYERLHSEPT